MAHTPYGYRIKNGAAVIDDEKAAQVRALFTEYVDGSALQAAADKLGIKRKHTSLGRMIADKRYIGDNFYPTIVDRELWSKAQDERKQRAEALGRNKNYLADDKTDITPFWGKIFCAECGSEYRRYEDNGKERWRCSRRIVKGRLFCNSPMIPETLFEAAFMEIIRSLDIEKLKVKPPVPQIRIEQQFSDPFKQAEYVYSQVVVDDFEYQTEKLVAALQKIPEEFDGDMMWRIIKRIAVSHSGVAEFEFINRHINRKKLMINDGKKKRVGNTGQSKG